MNRQLLFSVTKSDLRVETFKTGGHGGQGRDKRDTGVRITHPESGAVAISSDSRKQSENKSLAFRRLVKTEKFKAWHRVRTAHALGHVVAVDEAVDLAMLPENLKIEIRHDGRWIEVSE